MPPASLSTLEVMMPGPMRAKKTAKVFQVPLREVFSVFPGDGVSDKGEGKVVYPLLP
jgi:hypothetical protein